MGTTELEEVQALLEHVLPDPSGYTQRLLMQAVARWGNAARIPDGLAFYPPPPYDMPDSSVPSDQDRAEEPAINTNLLLAAALGACECWGLDAGCASCAGCGSAGWMVPDRELFGEFVQPAITKLSGAADGPSPGSSGMAGGGPGHRAEQRVEPGESR